MVFRHPDCWALPPLRIARQGRHLLRHHGRCPVVALTSLSCAPRYRVWEGMSGMSTAFLARSFTFTLFPLFIPVWEEKEEEGGHRPFFSVLASREGSE